MYTQHGFSNMAKPNLSHYSNPQADAARLLLNMIFYPYSKHSYHFRIGCWNHHGLTFNIFQHPSSVSPGAPHRASPWASAVDRSTWQLPHGASADVVQRHGMMGWEPWCCAPIDHDFPKIFTIWLFKQSHGIDGPNRNRWFTELKNGDFPWRTVK